MPASRRHRYSCRSQVAMSTKGTSEANAADLYPLTEAQLGIWFAHDLSVRKSLYSLGESIEVLGPIDPTLFEKALRRVVAETDALRLRFVNTDDGPRQYVIPELDWPLPIVDLSGAVEPRADARCWMNAAMAKGIDVTVDRPFDYALLRIAPDRFIWYTRYHHLCLDASGVAMVVKRAAAHYSALVTGQDQQQASPPSCLELLEVEREYRIKAWARDRDYWLSQLASRPARVTLAGTTPSWSEEFLSTSIDVPREIADRLRTRGAGCGASLSQVLLAAAAIYVHRFTGVTDFVMGQMVSGRPLTARLRDVIGTTANVVPLRLTIDARGEIDHLLRQIARRTLDVLRHQRYRCEVIRRDLHLQPSEPEFCGPIVNVLSFDYDVDFAGNSVAAHDIGNWRGDDMEFTIRDRGGAGDLRVELRANARLYSAPVLAAHVERLRAVLTTIASSSQRLPLGRVNVYLPGELERVTALFNATAANYPADTPLHGLFEARAAAQPDAPALLFDEEVESYLSLNRRANQLAHLLRSRGVRAGDVVAFCFERSPDMVVAMLGVLKAGAAYLPLDPGFPLERLDYMLTDSAPVLVLTQSALRGRLPLGGKPSLELDRERALLEDQEIGDLDPAALGIGSRSLAYVLYTSGSTGKPKGVEITHGALTNFLCSMQRAPGCGSDDTLLAVTTVSFDIAGLEIYLPLVSGGRVALATREEANDPNLLKSRMARCSATLMQATPATWRMLIESGWNGSPKLTILCGGEALSRELADQLLERSAALWNLYGPTETTVWSTIERVTCDAQPITIGRPIANTRIYILDTARQPVPIGAIGEIYIGGDGVARGYRNRLDLTEDRFVLDPFTDRPGERMYRTGDLGRFLPDGRIVHLGRSDDQVKIRGFRIELAEIESALVRHPAVAQAAVAAREDRGGLKQLVGYIVAREAARPSADELRAFLSRILPPYMVPSRFAFLDVLPLTANRKVDRKALPPPAEEIGAAASHAIEPRNHVERQLMALWQQVLGNASIGIHDNFFDAGGHSLNAVELASQIEKVYGIKLPLAVLLQAPTVEQLARLLMTSGWKPLWRSLVTIQASGRGVPVFAVPGVGGNVLVFAKLAKLLGSGQPFYGLQARGLDGEQSPFEAVAEAASHYISEMRTVRPHGPYIVCGACTGGVFAYEIAHQLVMSGERVTLVILETWHPATFRREARWSGVPWPIRFAWTRLVTYGRDLSRLPLRDWNGYLQRKLRTAKTALLPSPQSDEIVDVSAFASERVVHATLRAVADYETRPFAGGLLNVVAGNRRVAPGAVDTRRMWETLAGGPVRCEVIPAGDSGQLFVSPHVERLAELLSRYFKDSLDRPRVAAPSTVPA